MAFTPNQYLYRPSNVTLRDQQHAARVFTDDQFRLAPKHKFLFHVAFSLNPACLRDIDLVQRHRNEINLLVKECDLPNFNLTVETFNQYNRKKNVQLTHKYQPLNITFHDDNMGLINQMWQNYYAYYYADSTSATVPGAFNRTATKNANYINTAYGLDNRSSQNFFNYITIYQMARHEYVSYTLVNPVINSWNHNKVGYATSGTHDNTMTLMYESVSYSSGYVSEGDPEGFGVEHYDKTPSSLIGSIDAAPSSPTFAEPELSVNTRSNIVDTLTQQMNTYLNTKEKEGVNTTSNILKTVTSTGKVAPTNGLQGYQFPTSTNTGTTVKATQVPITQDTTTTQTSTTVTTIQSAQQAIDQLNRYAEASLVNPPTTVAGVKSLIEEGMRLEVNIIDKLNPLATTANQKKSLFNLAQAIEKTNTATRQLTTDNPQSLVTLLEAAKNVEVAENTVKLLFADSGLAFAEPAI